MLRMAELEASRIAQAVGDKLATIDETMLRSMGIEFDEIRPGYARMSMSVRGDMVGPHGVCRGLYIFALGDMACGFACCSWNRNSVAQRVDTFFMSPVRLGDRLSAEATEAGAAGKNSV